MPTPTAVEIEPTDEERARLEASSRRAQHRAGVAVRSRFGRSSSPMPMGDSTSTGAGAQLDSAARCPNSVASDGPPEDECDPGHARFRAWEVYGAATV
jgi:hypothetical protein